MVFLAEVTEGFVLTVGVLVFCRRRFALEIGTVFLYMAFLLALKALDVDGGESYFDVTAFGGVLLFLEAIDLAPMVVQFAFEFFDTNDIYNC